VGYGNGVARTTNVNTQDISRRRSVVDIMCWVFVAIATLAAECPQKTAEF